MKKIKKIWKENRVLFVLFIILIVCFIAIFSVALSYFVGSNKSEYGDRLNDYVKVTDEVKSGYIDALKEDKLVDNVTFRISVRTIYITIKFNSEASLVEAQSKALASVDNISAEVLDYYDINFIIKQDKIDEDPTKGFTLMGSHNISGEGVVWSNNTEIVEEEE